MSISDDGNNDAQQVPDCSMSSTVKVAVIFSFIVNHKKVEILSIGNRMISSAIWNK